MGAFKPTDEQAAGRALAREQQTAQPATEQNQNGAAGDAGPQTGMPAQAASDDPKPAGALNVYDGPVDGRQQASTNAPVSRFRPRYRALTGTEIALHDAIKAKAAELEQLIDQVKPGRYRSLGMTALEESVMWTVKELTS